GPGAAARATLASVVGDDPEYAYGSAQLRLAEAATSVGEPERALQALETFERNHGPSPESAYRRGRALTTLGERDRARAAFDEVGRLAQHAARYQRTSSFRWVTAAWFRRVFA
ncbi:MAG: tetratricopeptide repeat protein, partial [Planctomycetota bacterium]